MTFFSHGNRKFSPKKTELMAAADLPASLIISAYNQANSIKLVFESFQKYPPPVQEIIIADDGSSDTTSDLIGETKKKFHIPIHHVFQEDKGFRKARILNNAILKSRGRQLIFIDGDIIPFPGTLKRHIEVYQPYGYSVGPLVDLTLEESRLLLENGITQAIFKKKLTPIIRIKHQWQHLKNLLYIQTGKSTRPKLYGANFAVDRKLLYHINGFDMRFEGFSWEDSDLRNRMNNSGAIPRSLWHQAPALHISHGLDVKRIVNNSDKGRDIRKPELYDLNKKLKWIDTGLMSLEK